MHVHCGGPKIRKYLIKFEKRWISFDEQNKGMFSYLCESNEMILEQAIDASNGMRVISLSFLLSKLTTAETFLDVP